eukprot:CAMPEP_0174261274 /NCGR_PEP_ID=MMETSP0439-20130205/11339_1 /TAXON_ID=0 /ORGANISM="Stereomyxa ramosa, Strain Chinc5" /LENGTH=283 /DNA_ID=CAMNT_0015345727 /DNA_START=1 /DNA_END=852 /DNA_ORIENTATION=-
MESPRSPLIHFPMEGWARWNPFVRAKCGYWWCYSYLLDWALIIVGIVIAVPITYFGVDPFKRYEPPGDQNFDYPYLDDTVPSYALGLICVAPIFIFAILQIAVKSGHDFHHACLGLCESLAFTLILTQVLKVSCGRYRPDWEDREDESSSVQEDGRQSFPSGHSSMSFASMTFLSLYLCGKLGFYRKNGGEVWKAYVVLAPIAVSTCVAVTRVRDYHHHFSDILAGSIIGVAFAFMCYLTFYHSLFGSKSHVPKIRKVGHYYLHLSEKDKGVDEDLRLGVEEV